MPNSVFNSGMISDEQAQRMPSYDPVGMRGALSSSPAAARAAEQREPGGYEYDVGRLMWGEPNEREAFVARYGYEHSLDVINRVLKSNSALDGSDTGGGAWYKDMKDYRDELLSRQGY